VYSISFEGSVVYIGMTCDMKRRQKTHNYLYKKGLSKQLYDWLRQRGFDGSITLKPIHTFDRKVESKRMEVYLILKDYFGRKLLKQKVPSIGR
jgi:hypothetical protein